MIIRQRQIPSDIEPLSGLESPLLQRLYQARGVRSTDELDLGLPKLIDPACLRDGEKAARLLADAVEAGKRLLIVGDFDADGATSCAVGVLALSALGAAWVDFIVPNRFEYGYGLTPEIVAVAAQQAPDLIITVDNGIASIDGVAEAHELGIPVVITDHHLPGEQLPAAAAIVNPNQRECEFPSKHLAGVGVIFYLMLLLRSELRRRGWFVRRQLAEPNLAELLDLVALGTVADVVVLDANNRRLVEQGLRRIRAGRCRPGISALLKVAGRDPAIVQAADMGFAVGPRLNAAGRLDDMSIGIRCLLSEDSREVEELAHQLDAFNRERRQIESTMQQQAEASLQALSLGQLEHRYTLCLYDAEWHQGVIGILASRIKERYHRPVIIFADGDADMIKGSARSIAGFHMRDALDYVATQNPGMIDKFGGHAMAAGLTLPRANFARFCEAFEACAQCVLSAEQLQAEFLTDGELPAQLMTLPTAQNLQVAGPWGQGFPEPSFNGDFDWIQGRIVGGKHLKLVVRSEQANHLVDAIAFNVDVDFWQTAVPQRVRLVYRLSVNQFRGQSSLQFMVDYIEAL